MEMTNKNLLLSVTSLASLVLLSGCGGGGGTPTPSYNTSIAQPSLPGTVVQILQNTGSGVAPIPANSDGSYSITDSTPVIINAQTTQGLEQSLNWGFAATDSSNLNYAQLSTGGYQVAGSTDPILQQLGYSGLATVPSVISNPTGGSPLQFQSLIAPGGSLILGLSQGLTVASGPFQANAVFRVVSAYAGDWSVSYAVSGMTNPVTSGSIYSGTCNIAISNSGVVNGNCNDTLLGKYDVTGRDYGAGNAMGVQFQGMNGIVNFFLGTSPVASNLLQGKSNLFVTTSSTQTIDTTSGTTTSSGTSTSGLSTVTTISAEDPIACHLVPGATFVQIANSGTCANTVVFGTNSSSSETTIPSGSATNSGTSGTSNSSLPVTWAATRKP